MPIRTTSLLAILSVLSTQLPATALPLSQAESVPQPLPGLVSRRVQLDLARRLNVPLQDIAVEKATPQTWSDRCLELAAADESCAQGTEEGWRIEVSSPQQSWMYRSDRTATQIRLEPLPNNDNLDSTDFSAALSQTLLKTVSQQVQYPAEDLQIAQVEATTWNSCLGIVTADAICEPSAIPGFKVIVTENEDNFFTTLYRNTQGQGGQGRAFRRDWVYHLNADATQVVQNTTASDLSGRAQSWLGYDRNNLEPLNDTVVFQMIADTYAASSQTIITLMADGELTHEFVNYKQGKALNSETLSQQIPLERVTFFQTLLEQQQFSNFDRMGYGNEDYYTVIEGSIVVRTPQALLGTSAQEKDLPRSLRIILDAWSEFAI